jgi:N,N'-diacetyllegionaminate synthase
MNNNKKIVFISELCQNHKGNFETIKKMAYECAKSGSQIIKLQNIFVKDLSFRTRFENGFFSGSKNLVIKRPYIDEFKRLKKLEVSHKNLEKFVRYCEKLGVKPSITCFNRGSVKSLYNLGFKHIKIASYDCSSFQLIRDISAKFNSLTISTGATYDDEIQKTVKILKEKKIKYNLLHCVTIYPTPMKDLNLSRIKYLQNLSKNEAGFSDHTLGQGKEKNLACKLAIINGAKVLERHITINDPSDTRDGKVSIYPEDVNEILSFSKLNLSDQKQYISEKYKINPNSHKGMIKRNLTHQELLNRDYYKGRFTTFIKKRSIENWDEVSL